MTVDAWAEHRLCIILLLFFFLFNRWGSKDIYAMFTAAESCSTNSRTLSDRGRAVCLQREKTGQAVDYRKTLPWSVKDQVQNPQIKAIQACLSEEFPLFSFPPTISVPWPCSPLWIHGVLVLSRLPFVKHRWWLKRRYTTITWNQHHPPWKKTTTSTTRQKTKWTIKDTISICLCSLNRKMLARGNGPSIVLFTALIHTPWAAETQIMKVEYMAVINHCYSMLQYT